ncbi:hypothetical protein BH23BAC3_BH23BAC3_24560 [soil metagenome]
MIILPTKLTTTMLRSFWIVFCTLSLSIVSIVLLFFLNSALYLLILLLIPVVILPGYKYPDRISKFYILFNRIISKIVREVQSLILFIIYYVFFSSFKRSGNKDSSFNRIAPKQSVWNLKRIENLSGHETINDVARDSSIESSGIRPFIKWIRKSGNLRILPSIPFIYILTVLNISTKKSRTEGNTYTLY